VDFNRGDEAQKTYKTIMSETARWPGHAGGHYTREQWKRCAELGLLGLSAPEQHGGSGMGALATAQALEAFGRGYEDMGLVFGIAAHLLACVVPISEFGGEQVKAAVLPNLCNGTWIAANAITEESAGSDIHALTTTATKAGHDYVLSGRKSFVSNGPIADVFLVYAVTNPLFGHLGISAFLVDRDTPGLTVGAAFDKTSLTSCPASYVDFQECRVAGSRRIGEEGAGAQIFQHSMQWERSCLFAAYVGLTDRILTKCVDYANTRRQFGRTISSNQAISHRLVNARLRLEASRLLLWKACWKMDCGERAVMDVGLAKLAISEGAIQMGLDAMQIFGSQGVLTATGIEGALRDSLPTTLFSGTSEMQRDLVAKEMGL